MKSTGIIAEFNPFHNGHLYHMEQSRERTGSDYLIVIISGDFTQRGLPAVYRKYMRVRSALLSGADLVLEMPVFGSVAPAADFADCGVSMLTASGAADVLSFGSECGNLQALERQAALLSSETESQSQAVKAALRSGMSWPKARAMAYESLGGISGLPRRYSWNRISACPEKIFVFHDGPDGFPYRSGIPLCPKKRLLCLCLCHPQGPSPQMIRNSSRQSFLPPILQA